jgi:O-antigen/teichoic acid export membrane protein
MPFYAGLAATARPLVLTVLGPQWGEAVPVVRLLAFAMPFVTLHILFSPATNALGRPGVAARSTAAGAVILPVAFLIGVRFGPVGMAAAWVAAMPLLLAISAGMALPVIGLRAGVLARAVLPPVAAAIAMGGLVAGVASRLPAMAPAAELALLVPLGVAAYAGFALLLARPLVRGAIAMARGRAAG